MGASTVLFSMISLAAGSYFSRTVAALLVSYMVILPLALAGVLFYAVFSAAPVPRLILFGGLVPLGCFGACAALLGVTAKRLMYPSDVGSQGAEVVDLEHEQREALGMIIRSHQFPDRGHFVFGHQPGPDIVDTQAVANRAGHGRIVAGQHHRLVDPRLF